MILYSTDPKVRYSIIHETKNDIEEDIMCDACLDDLIEENNELVICDQCNAAVHQSCYGNELIKKVPEGNWYCMRCLYLKSHPEAHAASIMCAFCNDLKGIMIKDSKGVWAHLTCVNWIPEIWFMDDNRDTIGG